MFTIFIEGFVTLAEISACRHANAVEDSTDDVSSHPHYHIAGPLDDSVGIDARTDNNNYTVNQRAQYRRIGHDKARCPVE